MRWEEIVVYKGSAEGYYPMKLVSYDNNMLNLPPCYYIGIYDRTVIQKVGVGS